MSCRRRWSLKYFATCFLSEVNTLTFSMPLITLGSMNSDQFSAGR